MWKEMNGLPEDQKQALSVLLMDYSNFGITDLIQDIPAQWLKDPQNTPLKSAPLQPKAQTVTQERSSQPTKSMATRLQKKEEVKPETQVAAPVSVEARIENSEAKVLFMLTGEKSAVSASEIALMGKIAGTLIPDVEAGYITVDATSRYELQKEKMAPLLESSNAEYVLVWGQEAVNALHGEEILLREAAKVRDVCGKTCLYFYHPRTILRQGNLKKMAWHEVLSAKS